MKISARLAAVVPAVAISALAAQTPALGQNDGINKINHVVVIYQENWSFDSLYGKFPGANGIGTAGNVQQVKLDGSTYDSLPQAIDNNVTPPKPDTRIPASLPVKPFDLTQYIQPTDKTGDIVHRYYQEQVQIDGGKNDKFLAGSDNPGLVMSYYDASQMPEGKLAQQYVMADNFFHSAYGGSFLNHQFLICACAPKWDTAAKPVPEAKRTVLDSNGLPASGKDGFISATPDNYIINTAYTVNTPHPKPAAGAADNTPQLVPNLTDPTIGDRLSDKNLTWKWYSGGWDLALAGTPDKDFQFHHQPFAFYKNYADGTDAKKQHLQDEVNFFNDAAAGNLPAVSFVKPLGPDNEHPGYASLQQGQRHVANLVQAIKNSPNWKDTAIVITYDEHGGRWDHVAPPRGDKWGPGLRVPAIIISPFARQATIDHTQMETLSILKFMETRWGLQPLGTRDAAANDMTSAFDFNGTPNNASSGGGSSTLAIVAVVVVVLLAAGVVFYLMRRPRQA